MILDLEGKHGRVRTVPMAAWVKATIDNWTGVAGIEDGYLFPPMRKGGRIQPRPEGSRSEKRIMILIDDADTLLRQILTRKVHSRAHCCRNLGFSEYKWNRAMRLLRHLDIYDDYRRHLNCSYREARLRIRKHMQNQIELGRASDSFVPSV